MKKSLWIALTFAAAALTAAPAMAHHNANAQYDNSKEFEVTGTLVELRDIAPHAQWKATFVDPKTKAQTTYQFEALGNNALRRVGIQVKTDIKVGRQYGFVYSPARDGSASGFLTAIIIDGKKFQLVKL